MSSEMASPEHNVQPPVDPTEVRHSIWRSRKFGAFLVVAAAGLSVVSAKAFYEHYQIEHPPIPDNALVEASPDATHTPEPTAALTAATSPTSTVLPPSASASSRAQAEITKAANPTPAPKPVVCPPVFVPMNPAPVSLSVASPNVHLDNPSLLPLAPKVLRRDPVTCVADLALNPPLDYKGDHQLFYAEDQQQAPKQLMVLGHTSYHGNRLAAQDFNKISAGTNFSITFSNGEVRTYVAEKPVSPNKAKSDLQTSVFDAHPDAKAFLITCDDTNNDYNDIIPGELVSDVMP